MTQTTSDSDVLQGLRDIVDNADAGRVFGTPVLQDGMIVLPVAKIGTGGGGGSGTGPDVDGRPTGGTGGGFGVSARALGVYILRDGKVGWRPAIDVNKIILGGQLVVITALLVARSVLNARADKRGHGRRTSRGLNPRRG
jgi:uncharacterized spore protein YtfJ